MNWINGRPDDWEKTTAQIEYEIIRRNHSLDIAGRTALVMGIRASADAMLSARNQWWLSKVQNQAGQCHLHMCEYIDDKCNRRFACADCSWWQTLKREVGQ